MSFPIEPIMRGVANAPSSVDFNLLMGQKIAATQPDVAIASICYAPDRPEIGATAKVADATMAAVGLRQAVLGTLGALQFEHVAPGLRVFASSAAIEHVQQALRLIPESVGNFSSVE